VVLSEKQLTAKYLVVVSVVLALVFTIEPSYNNIYADPFFENGRFTPNGIEWCHENLPLYEILGDRFFEHHKHSIESRVCASLYEDPLDYAGPDRTQKMIEKSQYYTQLEISESIDESKTGIIDTAPAASRNETLLRGMTEDGKITVQVIATKPAANIPMQINVSFLDSDDNSLISDVNYEISAIQQGKQVIPSSHDNNIRYSENGLATLQTISLESEGPVTINIEITGIGLPENSEEWIIPPNEQQVIAFTVIPEFGQMAAFVMIITVSIAVILTMRGKFSIPV